MNDTQKQAAWLVDMYQHVADGGELECCDGTRDWITSHRGPTMHSIPVYWRKKQRTININGHEADLAAAELMGLPNISIDGGAVFFDFAYKSHKKMHRNTFSLANKADRMDFVEWMGKNHGITPVATDGGHYSGAFYLWDERKKVQIIDAEYATHTEACRAAAIYLKEVSDE